MLLYDNKNTTIKKENKLLGLLAGFRELVCPETRMYEVGSFPPVVHPLDPPHTLLLGTMPSTASHAEAQYYAHPSNRAQKNAEEGEESFRTKPNLIDSLVLKRPVLVCGSLTLRTSFFFSHFLNFSNQ